MEIPAIPGCVPKGTVDVLQLIAVLLGGPDMTIPDIPGCLPKDTVGLLQIIATLLGTGGVGSLSGTGSPEGVTTANVGTFYTDLSNTDNPGIWVKATGSGNTGWRNIVAAGP